MTGASGVLALVLAEAAAGGAALLFLTPLRSEVRRGFFYLTGGVVIVLALSAAASTGSGAAFADPGSARTGMVLALALGATTFAAVAVLAARRPLVGLILGVGTAGVAIGMLVMFAIATGGGFVLSLVQLLAGAVFTGAVLDGLLLGHWYLTDRKLPRQPINRMAWVLVGAVGVEAVAVLAGLGSPGPETSSSLSPLLTVAGNATWIAFGMVACTGLIAAFIRA
ncbi:MAG: hypothetical protein ABR518_09595, partial [Actinomycetota bacterium]